ncbi:MAG: sugar phosphate isomerase/epimerase family protein [Bryobacterales bacterium]|nr:sugar phosphate isomerase/epimerase family protein [Bryobacterales bacterium]
MNRRDFVAASAALAGAGNLAAARLPIRKGVYVEMLPKGSWEERFRLARAVGFEDVELATTPDMKEAEAAKKAAEATGIRIHSVMNQAHWKFPLSSPDPAVVAQSIQGMETSLRNAKFWGADTVLLVPAVVSKEVGYKDAWDRSVQAVRKLLPLAEKLKVVIGIENVWNKFLLSPIEFASYVDQFKSPWVKAYFDVGNIVLYGFPQDWIRTLGKRIVKLHFKDFSLRRDPAIKKSVADFCALREGDVDWKAVHQALAGIGFQGTATVELPGGDEAYLREVSKRVDLILEGA